MEFHELLQFIELQEQRLRKCFPQLSKKEMCTLIHTIKLSEEVGELCEQVLTNANIQRKKKLQKSNGTLGEEAADVIITTLILAKASDINIEQALKQKISKINRRFQNIK